MGFEKCFAKLTDLIYHRVEALLLGLDLLITFRTESGIREVLSKAYRLFIPPCLGLAFGPRPPNHF